MSKEIKTMEDLHIDDDDQLNNSGAGNDGAEDNGKGADDLQNHGGDGTGDNREGETRTGDDGEGSGDDSGESGKGGETPLGTGIEQYLSQYNIQGGMLQLEGDNGGVVEKHYNDLTPEEQLNVLTSLAKTGRTTEEERYALTEAEIAIINRGRNENKSIEEAIEELAQSRAEQLIAFKQAATLDFMDMEDDAVYLHSLKEANPEADADTLNKDLELAKQLSTYSNNVKQLRDNYRKTQEVEQRDAEARIQGETEQRLDEDRRAVVKVVSQLDNVAGWPLTADDKNEVLSQLLEVDENQNSLFVAEVFSDPNKMFKAAWNYYNAEKKFDEMANYYKAQMNESYLKGKADALGNRPDGNKFTSRVDPARKQEANVVEKRDRNNFKTMDDIHDD